MPKLHPFPKAVQLHPAIVSKLKLFVDMTREHLCDAGWPQVSTNTLLTLYDICLALELTPTEFAMIVGLEDYNATIVMLGDLEDDSPPWDE